MIYLFGMYAMGYVTYCTRLLLLNSFVCIIKSMCKFYTARVEATTKQQKHRMKVINHF